MPNAVDSVLWDKFIDKIDENLHPEESILNSYCDRFMNNFFYYVKTDLDTIFMMMTSFEDGEEVLVDEYIFDNINFSILENIDYKILEIVQNMYKTLHYDIVIYSGGL
jgi:hypothetical protein